MTERTPWPTEVRLHKDRRAMSVTFDDGVSHDLPAEMLRVMSPSAEVQGHTPGERKTIGGKRGVWIAALEPVGNYAVKIVFNDGHDSGLFSWGYLRQLSDERETRWTEYLDELAAKGMSRDA